MKARLARFLCWLFVRHEWLPSTVLPLSGRAVEECPHCDATRVLPRPRAPRCRPRQTLFVDLRLP